MSDVRDPVEDNCADGLGCDSQGCESTRETCPRDPYVKLAAELYVSRECAKRLWLEVGYGGGDPWLRFLAVEAINQISVSSWRARKNSATN